MTRRLAQIAKEHTAKLTLYPGTHWSVLKALAEGLSVPPLQTAF